MEKERDENKTGERNESAETERSGGGTLGSGNASPHPLRWTGDVILIYEKRKKEDGAVGARDGAKWNIGT